MRFGWIACQIILATTSKKTFEGIYPAIETRDNDFFEGCDFLHYLYTKSGERVRSKSEDGNCLRVSHEIPLEPSQQVVDGHE